MNFPKMTSLDLRLNQAGVRTSQDTRHQVYKKANSSALGAQATRPQSTDGTKPSPSSHADVIETGHEKKQQTAAVIGCGQMGADIAAIFLHGGWDIVAVTKDPNKWASRKNRIASSVEALGKSSASVKAGDLTFQRDISSVPWKNVDLVIESAPEDFDLKRSIFASLDKLVPSHVPIVTNTSGHRISEIAEGCATANRMAGLHFFFPAHIAPLVEVVRGEKTDEAIMGLLINTMKTLGRMPVRVNRDIPGFLANRIQHALMREAWSLVDEGFATAADVDKAVRYGFGFRYLASGPIMQKELTGLDTQLAAATVIYPSLNNNTEPSRFLAERVERGETGADAGKGVWQWTPEQVDIARNDYSTTLAAAADLLRSSRISPPDNKP